ncbi:hypothetical protein [Dickeya oryzae]|uniref:Uncharacterized protein n=1 Tax=Dickeya oryzae TaxID=1240404 RepID=A0AB39IN58_9GAMM|nr:hypothetical protein [Dickeya oryzae]MBP2848498.1 hypothetical protein [Dickeya oryzae]MBP2857356.1 hypothetical protein [Dickeya oryzae]MCA6991007.1 hypothetical protein [Dickeya oryzae]MCA6993321.1 hypothetical protein [Dickeya oryzae]
MKKTLLLIMLTVSLQSHAAISLVKNNDASLMKTTIEDANKRGIVDIKIQEEQAFDVNENNNNIGTIIPGKGFYKNYYPVCFISWSTDKKTISNIVLSMGNGDFEFSQCENLDAVGKIESAGKTFIGFVYSVGLPDDRTEKNYFLLEIDKNKKTITDKSNIVDALQNTDEIKSITAIRKHLKKEMEK